MQLEGEVMRAVQQVHVDVDKEELIRALQYDRNQYEKGFRDGVASVQQWIPVTERLPKPYENVIGWTKYRERGVVSHNGKRFVWEDDEGDYAHVTHWMPLPEAPKDGDT